SEKRAKRTILIAGIASDLMSVIFTLLLPIISIDDSNSRSCAPGLGRITRATARGSCKSSSALLGAKISTSFGGGRRETHHRLGRPRRTAAIIGKRTVETLEQWKPEILVGDVISAFLHDHEMAN